VSIDVANAGIQPHVHSLEDDLESLLYVVLYCALRWLSVDTDPGAGLDWWLTQFFGGPNGYAPAASKSHNATTRYYTRLLTATDSQAILDWLNAAMDLHYHAEEGSRVLVPNPLWNGGKALEAMWRETLKKGLPENDRRENRTPNMIRREVHSLHATYSTGTTSAALFASRNLATTKRSVSESSGVDNNTDSFDRNSDRQRSSDPEGDAGRKVKKPRRSTKVKGKDTPSTEGRPTTRMVTRQASRTGGAPSVASSSTLRRSTKNKK